MFHPAGHRIVVRCIELDEISKGGILIPDEVQRREQFSMTVGYLVEAGELAWWDWGDGNKRGKHWAKPGQRVLFAKYGGSEFTQRIKDPANNNLIKEVKFRLLNDEDILAIDDNEEFDVAYHDELVKKMNKNRASVKEKIGDV